MNFGKKIASIKFELSLSPDFFSKKDFVGPVDDVGQNLKDIGSSLLAMFNCFDYRYVYSSGYISKKMADSQPETKVNWVVKIELNRDDLIRFDKAIKNSQEKEKKDIFVCHAHFEGLSIINIYCDEYGFYIMDFKKTNVTVQNIAKILKSKV